MNVTKTRNVVFSEKGALRMVDDFALSSEKPTPGAWHFLLTLGELPPMPITLCAAADDLRKIKEWMEAIARDERHCSVVFGSGASLCCDITDIPESAVIKTYRFLDEQFPSPIARVTATDDNGNTCTAILKIKHFLNYLYIEIQRMPYRRTEEMKNLWYAHTAAYRESADVRAWVNGHPYYHRYFQASALMEWYLQSTESYTVARPQLRELPPCVEIVIMWVDYCSIFWSGENGGSIGDCVRLGIGSQLFDFSDIRGLLDWYSDFEEMEEKIEFNDYKSTAGMARNIKKWQIRGFRLARKIRKRLPSNAVLIYRQTGYSDCNRSSHYYRRDNGRILFDPACLKTGSGAEE